MYVSQTDRFQEEVGEGEEKPRVPTLPQAKAGGAEEAESLQGFMKSAGVMPL